MLNYSFLAFFWSIFLTLGAEPKFRKIFGRHLKDIYTEHTQDECNIQIMGGTEMQMDLIKMKASGKSRDALPLKAPEPG